MEDINANKTGNKRPLSTTSEESNVNPANSSDIYFKTPDPKSTKKSHKETNPTSKKPKHPLFSAFTLDDILEPAKNYIEDKNYNHILNYI